MVIADSKDPIGIGGVIGGANSEIGESTTSVLLESATFDGYNNRDTAQNLHLRTEATLRFEKGLRCELAPIALRRATKLIQESAGGRIASGIIDVFPGRPPEFQQETQKVCLTAERLNKVLGMEFEPETVDRVLNSLGFS
ncbi:MAG: phenylalanine--tRNA ligase subunit beta, partial [Chloroflexi bacterium]|nr:phenylalanine--tRNA ligase subunit beta [Chloroflexota bacterium]